MQAMLGILAAFIALGFLIYMRVEFGRAILIASGVLLLISKPSLTGIDWIIEISLEYETLRLISIIVQIGFLGYIYKDSGQVERMIEELKGVTTDRRQVISSIPAIFGLLPMPGGALVSAPMIDDEGEKLGVSAVHKTFLNWWFRHIWFTVYPLSLGLILAAGLSGISLYKIAMFNLPIFAVQIIAGIIWGTGGIDKGTPKKQGSDPLVLIWELLPIITALLLNIVFDIPLYFTLLIAIGLLLFQNRDSYEGRQLPSLAKKGFSLDLLFASYGIMLFKGIVERSNSIEPAVSYLQSYLPLLFVIMIAAMAVGLLFGHLPGAVGVGFPVLLTVMPVINVQTVGLIFLFTFLGYLISPIHLCIILTIEYFGTDLKSFYKKAFYPIIALTATIVAWLMITGAFFYF